MSRLFGRARKPLIDANRYTPADCWFCGGDLPPAFTTVEKNGVRHRVHYGCRSAAEDIVRTGRLIQDPIDYEDLPA